jgi:integrase
VARNIENHRGKIRLYFDLRGKRIKQFFPQYDFEKKANWFREKILKPVGVEIDTSDWKALLLRFPNNKTLKSLHLPGAAKIGELLDDLEDQWKIDDARSRVDLIRKNKDIRAKFEQKPAVQLMVDDIRDFRRELEAKGNSPATINRKLQNLCTALNLAVLNGKLEAAPKFIRNQMLEEDNVREGRYFERWEIEAVIEKLPEHLRGVVRVAYLTGWRKSEILSRHGYDVTDRFLQLDKDHSKNKKERAFPLNIPGIKAALDEQQAFVRRLEMRLGRVIPWLFPNAQVLGPVALGEPMEDFEKAWETAVLASGIPLLDEKTGKEWRRLFKDLRNTAITNLNNLGLSPLAVAALVGHKTLDMQGRYYQSQMWDIGEQARALTASQDAKSTVVKFPVPQASHSEDFANQAASDDFKKTSNSGGFFGGQGVN